MTKLLIIEGGDRLGKGTLIKGLCEYFNYKNITIRHCDKPPKNLSNIESYDFQYKAFKEEFKLIHNISYMNFKYRYHDNIIIYDRFYPGEYVYSTMFRKGNPKSIKEQLIEFEKKWLSNFNIKPYLITLTADPKFFHSKEDGNSFSNTLEDKSKELELFKEAHNFSVIPKKLLIKVDKRNGKFRSKSNILNEVIKFIEYE